MSANLTNSTPVDPNYLSNLELFNQLTGGMTPLKTQSGNTVSPASNKAKMVNWGFGPVQLIGALAVINDSPTAYFPIGTLPILYKPQADYAFPVSVIRGGATSVINTLVISKESTSIIGLNITSPGIYTTAPTLVVIGNGLGANLIPTLKAVTATPSASGTGYVVGDTITLTGGTASEQAGVTVSTLRLESVAVNAGGSDYAPGNILTLVGGTNTSPATVTVSTVDGGGAITGMTLTTRGSYTVGSTTFTATGGDGTGATFNTGVFGVNSVTISKPGSYTVLPTNPAAQGSTSGSGTGATFTMAYGLLGLSNTSTGGIGYTPSETTVTVSSGAGRVTPVFSIPVTGQLYLVSAPATGDVVFLASPPLLVKSFN